MPIYMDRHDVSEGVSAEHVAKIHTEDLKIEHKYGCRGFTYWFDEDKNAAFCLIEAPNKEAIVKMHNEAHGGIPHLIIEVDERIVESFLGRVTDPEKSKDVELNIINDPAFRVIMVLETSNFLNRVEAKQFSIFSQKFHNSASKTIKQFGGRVVKQDNNSYLISFKSVTDAVLCALKIQSNYKYITPKFDLPNRRLKIGISSGIPVTEKNELFEDAITTATRICEIVKNQVVITQEVKKLYESENRNSFIDQDYIRALKPNEEKFLNQLMDYIETVWSDSSFSVNNFSKALGYSKSQIYRKLVSLTGKSPNNFIKDFRLNRALALLYNQSGNIQEVAYESGFNSAAYFTKCFFSKFGILPSKYTQQHIN